MRIAVLAHGLRTAGGRTVGHRFVRALGEGAAQGHDFDLLVPEGVGYEALCAEVPGLRWVRVPSMGRLARLRFDHRELPRRLRAAGCDALLALGNVGLIDPPVPQAVLLHQPHLVYPSRQWGPVSAADRLRHRYLRWRFHAQLPRTGLVFCQTAVMAARLRRVASGVPVEVCGIGADGPADAAADCAAPPEPMGRLRDRFRLLYPARYYPHKNHELLLRALEPDLPELRDVTVFLTLDADQHRNAARLLRRLRRGTWGLRVVNLGPIPAERMAAAYAHADAVVVPSLLETAGLPYVEAMAAGRPVIAADLDFARSQCGDAALYFDPWSPAALRDAIATLRRDVALRARLAAAGRVRAGAAFPTWTEVAARLVRGTAGLAGAGRNPMLPEGSTS